MNQTSNAHSHILTESGTNELEVMSFFLRWADDNSSLPQQATFGINAAKIKELIAVPTSISRLPSQPASMLGIFILRERVIPLVDLCRWFGFREYAGNDNRKDWVVIVTEIYAKHFGFIVHGVDNVHRVSWQNVEPPPPYLRLKAPSIVSNARIGDQIIQMVDFERIAASIDPSVTMEMEMVPPSPLSDDSCLDEPATAGPQVNSRSLSSHLPNKILFADDSRMIRDHVSAILRKSGYEIILASDGQLAWELLQEIKTTAPNGKVEDILLAIISDIEMPRIDGHHLCKKIKEDRSFEKIPVLLFSSLISPALRSKGIAVGADDQVSKPDLPGLVARLRESVDKVRSRTTGAGGTEHD